ncbi:MAG: hypothetical protein ACOC9P_02090, partial [bacterium]
SMTVRSVGAKVCCAERLRNICQPAFVLPDNFFTELKAVRHDAVHRGGRTRGGQVNNRRAYVLNGAECILRETIKWAILNLPDVARAFERDLWPNNLHQSRQ